MQRLSTSQMLALLLAVPFAAIAAEVAHLRATSSALQLARHNKQVPYGAPGKTVEGAPWEDIPVEEPEATQPTQDCGPKCQYDCAQPECHSAQECDPVCDPPKCETSCSSSSDLCETRCGEPLCAVVCPQTECQGVHCTSSVKCQTVCSPPVCTTSCADSCKTFCAKPTCQWNCRPHSQCPEPNCQLSCSELDCPAALSSVVGNETAREKARQKARQELEASLRKQGRVLVAQAHAYLDPDVLNSVANGPPDMGIAAVPTNTEATTQQPVPVMAEPAVARELPSASTRNGWMWGALKAPADH